MRKSTKKTVDLKTYGIEMWSQPKIEEFRETLLNWYDKEKRDLPWRRREDAYAIWVSEIMLQQTRVDTVIPYFNRFLKELPTIKSLAEAEEDGLLKLWEGLGYYSRVKNMQFAARQIMMDFGGQFPNEPKDIQKLKGIGPYTSGAIASMAFQLPEPAVDGNVMRVLSRLFEIDLDIAKPSNRKVYEVMIRELIDPVRPGDFNQALMDLGATVCTPKNYHPEKSPVKNFNQSFLNDTWETYPIKSKGKKAIKETYIGLLVENEKGQWLLEKRPSKGLLADMWTFPLLSETIMYTEEKWKSFDLHEKKPNFLLDEMKQDKFKEYVQFKYGIEPKVESYTYEEIKHVFSHIIWSIQLVKASASEIRGVIPDRCEWVDAANFDQYVFPVPQQKMWNHYNSSQMNLFRLS
ncbi:A/G-specific adenine glycosylase [Lacticigenium naphthae]|uniref:A/G-specific adenine glycosylase n=1 Tax=Lacticigenium naphthae TaxID=515351 RepID=UPI0003FB0B56|nr:A/G-specific adenine glycosylase [Lacticigenium naphthae]